MAQRGYRSKESYLGRSPEAIEKQLNNLKGYKKSKKKFPLITHKRYYSEDSSGIKLFIQEQGRNQENKPLILLPWWEEALDQLFVEDEEERKDLFIISTHKKASKTSLGAIIAIYYAIFYDAPSSIVLASNSKDQSKDVGLRYIKRMIKLNHRLKDLFKIRLLRKSLNVRSL